MLRSKSLGKSLTTLLSESTPCAMLLTQSGALLSEASLPDSPYASTPLLAILSATFSSYSPLSPSIVTLQIPSATIHVAFILNKYLLATVSDETSCEGAVKKRMEGLVRTLEESLGRVEA